MRANRYADNAKGFSLIELIVVIVLLGIMSAGAGMLITRPIEAYRDQSRRQELVDLAEISLRKIAADIRAALPNSIRRDISTPGKWVLEMVNTVDGARYRDDFGGVFVTENDRLTFTLAGDSNFNLLGQFSTLPTTGLPITYNNFRAVIYNTDPASIYADAASSPVNSPGIISPSGITLSINAGPPAVHHLNIPQVSGSDFRFLFQSPSQRMFLVDGPISYVCDSSAGTLTRYNGYAYQASQPLTFAGANVGVITSKVSGCNILYQSGTAQRGGLITIDLSITSGDETVRLMHQVHVDNVP